MFDIREAMLKSYRGKLEEYRKIIGALPAETDERLANIILNPSNEREIAFCVSCLDFFNDITKTFKDITEEMEQNHECECVINNWIDMLNGFLHHQSYYFETKKEYYTEMLELRPELIDKLSTWTKEELKRVLFEPTTNKEYELCQEYLEYLAEEVEFKERKDRYLDRLAHREDVISKLSTDETIKGALEILLDPQTDQELDFCIAYFGFQDDIKQIKENISQKNLKAPNLEEESAIINSVARAVQVLCKRKPLQDELDFFFSASPEGIAEILYKLNCLESSDFDGLIKTISDKTGNKFGDIKLSAVPFSIFPKYYELYSAYTALSTWMHNYPIQRIDRNNSDAHINRFMRMAEVFHEEYITAAYSTAIPASASIKHEESKVKQKKPQETVASKPTDNK